MDTVEITELEKIDATRVDGVGTPANGIPILLMKAVAPEPATKGARDCPKCEKSYDADHKGSNCENCGTKLPAADAAKSGPPEWHADAVKALKAMKRGKVDETPDIEGGKQAIALVAKLIGYEADELAAGNLGESDDIALLSGAVDALKAWLSREVATQQGQTADDSGVIMASAAKADMSTSSINDLPDSAFAYIEPGGSKDEDGKTTPRSLRHFPVHDKAHADNAAARIAQGAKFGDKALPKVKAAQKKFGEDTSKAAVAADGTDVDTGAQGTDGQLAKAIEDAVTKATAPLQERLEALSGELAKVKATPIPGGPVMSAARPSTASVDMEKLAADAAYFRKMAESVSDPVTADGYRQLARQAAEKAKQTT